MRIEFMTTFIATSLPHNYSSPHVAAPMPRVGARSRIPRMCVGPVVATRYLGKNRIQTFI
jgi:hypothetical protein